MIWGLSLIALFFTVVAYQLFHEPTIAKTYSDKKGMYNTFTSYSASMAFDKHLANVRHEVRVRSMISQKENEIHNSSDDIGWDVNLYNPDNPKIYEKILYSPSQIFLRKLSYVILIIYVILILVIINPSLAISEEGLITYIILLGQFSLIPVIVWLHKRSHHDGRVEGFLNGYIAAQQDLFVFRYHVGNVLIDAAHLDNGGMAYDDKQPYSHGVRLWE